MDAPNADLTHREVLRMGMLVVPAETQRMIHRGEPDLTSRSLRIECRFRANHSGRPRLRRQRKSGDESEFR